MNGDTLAFNRFKLSPSEAETLKKDFVSVVLGTDLSRCERINHVVSDYRNVSGIYFWIMRLNGDEVKIYVGKTKSLSLRALNYTANFQPHSPNDFKLKVFRTFMTEKIPGSELDLHFCKTPIPDLTRTENDFIKKYKPMLNERMAASPAARVALEGAFSELYRSSFEDLLRHF